MFPLKFLMRFIFVRLFETAQIAAQGSKYHTAFSEMDDTTTDSGLVTEEDDDDDLNTHSSSVIKKNDDDLKTPPDTEDDDDDLNTPPDTEDDEDDDDLNTEDIPPYDIYLSNNLNKIRVNSKNRFRLK